MKLDFSREKYCSYDLQINIKYKFKVLRKVTLNFLFQVLLFLSVEYIQKTIFFYYFFLLFSLTHIMVEKVLFLGQNFETLILMDLRVMRTPESEIFVSVCVCVCLLPA